MSEEIKMVKLSRLILAFAMLCGCGPGDIDRSTADTQERVPTHQATELHLRLMFSPLPEEEAAISRADSVLRRSDGIFMDDAAVQLYRFDEPPAARFLALGLLTPGE